MSRRLIGMLAGWALWVAFVGMYFIYSNYARKFIPNSVRGIPDFLMIGVGVLAFPVGIGGWIWVWGDNRPPQWASGWTADVVVGLVVFGLLGVLGSPLFARHRLRLRAALIAITLFALVLVLSAIAKPFL